MSGTEFQAKPKVIEHPERNPNGFDTRVHIKDAKTGQLIKVQPHTIHFVGNTKFYEFPKFSGNLFFESGLAAGRWEAGKVVEGAAHTDFVAPITQERTFDRVVDENEALRAELAALKAEKETTLKVTEKKSAAPVKN